MLRIGFVLVPLLLATGAACNGDSDGDGDNAVDTTTATLDATTSSTSVGPTTTGAALPPAGVRDWDGVRYDIGALARIDRAEDGLALVVFDRVQLHTDDGLKSGKDFIEEPIVYGNTDAPFVNDNKLLRTYVADLRVEVLRLANLRQTCADQEDSSPATWEPMSVDRVVEESLWEEYPQVSLTFSADGRVTRIRLSTGC